MIAALTDQIRAAVASDTPLIIHGGGSKAFYGNSAPGELLDTRGLQGVVEYQPKELVLTARAGTSLHDIESLLAEHRQGLAFEPPHFGEATIGGAIATGLSGPRRATSGAARDFVLGVRVVDGRGQDLSFGGRVMKNVAGYDVSRLMVGSIGTLGVIAEISLKVLPVPPASETLVREASESDAVTLMNKWAGKPLPISATCYSNGKLFVRLAGAATAVAAARAQIGGEGMHDHLGFWESVLEQRHEFFQGGDDLWRLSVPPTTPPLGLPATLIEWGGAERWVRGNGDGLKIREAAAGAHGHATLFRSSGVREHVFTPLAPALATIHRNLKRQFDPNGIFNPGRIYADL